MKKIFVLGFLFALLLLGGCSERGIMNSKMTFYFSDGTDINYSVPASEFRTTIALCEKIGGSFSNSCDGKLWQCYIKIDEGGLNDDS